MKKTVFYIAINLMVACNVQKPSSYPTMGTLEKFDATLDQIIDPNAKAEVIAEGFHWSEGPLWIESQNMLLVSDVPQDTIFKWTEKKGKEVYLTPSGYTGSVPPGGEPGSNGLTLDQNGRLVLCQHGNRQMAKMNAPLDQPAPRYMTIANTYQGKKFNSPNDAVYNSRGELFFTDPPYGLEKQMEDPKKEISYQGVYKVKTNGDVILLLDSLTRPNGIAFFPGEKKLLVANSDPAKANWYIYDVEGDALKNGRVFFSAASYSKNSPGLPDGMKIDSRGNVIATGPGGVYFFNSEGKLLGRMLLENPTSNIALSPDEKNAFVTNDMYVLRIKMRD